MRLLCSLSTSSPRLWACAWDGGWQHHSQLVATALADPAPRWPGRDSRHQVGSARQLGGRARGCGQLTHLFHHGVHAAPLAAAAALLQCEDAAGTPLKGKVCFAPQAAVQRCRAVAALPPSVLMAAGIPAAHSLVTCTSRSSSSLEEPFRRVCTMTAAQRAARGAQARPPASSIHDAAVRQWRAPSECCWFESCAVPPRCSRELCHCLAVSCTRPMMDCHRQRAQPALPAEPRHCRERGSVPLQPPGRSTLACWI